MARGSTLLGIACLGLNGFAIAGGASEPPTPADSPPGAAALVAALESNRLDQARTLAERLLTQLDPGTELAAKARLVRLFAAVRAEDGRATRAALSAVLEHGPRLGNLGLYLEVSAAVSARDCAGAEERLAALPADSIFRNPAWARMVGCWIRGRDLPAAARAQREMLASAENDARRGEATLWAARLAEAGGDRRAARDLYRDVLVLFPGTGAARRAGSWLEAARRQGMTVSALSAEELLPRAESERQNARPARARRTYQSVIRQARGQQQKNWRHMAELGLVELDIVDRRYTRAGARLSRVLTETNEPELRAQALFLRGDIAARQGDTLATLLDYETIVSELPATAFATEAALGAAQLCYVTGRFTEARRFARFLLETAPREETIAVISGDGALQPGAANRQTRDQALWLLAWIERRSGATVELCDSYLAEIDADSPLADGALYWRTRLAIDGRRFADAEIFADLLGKRAPTSFYALAASDLLRRANPTCAVQLELPAGEPAVPELPPLRHRPRDLEGALVLAEHGLVQEARHLLATLPVHTLDPADRVAAAWLYRRCGDVYRSAALTRRVAATSLAAEDRTLLELAYPRPYEETVLEAAGETGVPPQLIYAVMRQESSFNPRAVSPRYARGLMQMIRPTALRMAEQANLRGFRQRQLFEPEISIRLGAAYLAALIAEFDGNLVAAVAAYHAGERNVGRWLAGRNQLAHDELIEELPNSSTREYVKKVLSSYGVYRLLYDQETRVAVPLVAQR